MLSRKLAFCKRLLKRNLIFRAQLQQEKKMREDAEKQRVELEERLKRYEEDIEQHKNGKELKGSYIYFQETFYKNFVVLT